MLLVFNLIQIIIKKMYDIIHFLLVRWMVFFKIQLSMKFAAYTNTYLYNIPLHVDVFRFNVPRQQNMV